MGCAPTEAAAILQHDGVAADGTAVVTAKSCAAAGVAAKGCAAVLVAVGVALRVWRQMACTSACVAGCLAGWQPIVYSKTAAWLLKAAWCLLQIATPCAVLRRLTEAAGRPAARCLHRTNLPHLHSSMSSVGTLLPLTFLLLF